MTAPNTLLAEELVAAKAYMRVDGDEDDLVVVGCVLGAREYLTQAGVALPAADTPRRALYDLVCHALALGTYDLRNPIVTGALFADNPQLRRSVIQLQRSEPME